MIHKKSIQAIFGVLAIVLAISAPLIRGFLVCVNFFNYEN